ncbi:hypothetical protein PSN13_06518 [Micromonospora saelicesensis]|uniref:Uncharacterized protein n=1 Tax=Micromonospora saelicesensis TaxID=285676 RepID=A0A328NGY0_9ACTN|nr:hypothetical protein [Micromonospora saelicesensis]RAO26490.1 hypothetical protein PSN13_06518 [Micromonospora saelicesensis]
MSTLPEPACRYGYTVEQLQEALGDRADAFGRWMSGQTGAICDGRAYDYDACEYRETNCGPHGSVVYSHDLRRFLAGGRPLD